MTGQRLILMEASKVRAYHSTVMEGILRAYHAAGLGGRLGRPMLLAHQSFYDHLSEEARDAVEFSGIRVVDPDDRKLIRKSLLEFWVVLRAMLALQPKETLLVTTLLPSALLLVELAKAFMPRKRVIVLLHGELEGLVDEQRQGPKSYGFYVAHWLRIRPRNSSLGVAVLDRFIAEKLAEESAGRLDSEHINILPMPMMSGAAEAPAHARFRCCFVGYPTEKKGYPIFEELSKQNQRFDFVAIGGGEERNLATGEAKPLARTEDFLAALADCDIALFPYTSGYVLTFSAAATDAIAAGLHIVATPLPFFRSLEDAFGSDIVTLRSNESEFRELLQDEEWFARIRNSRRNRLQLIAGSRFGLAKVGRALNQMLLDVDANHLNPKHGTGKRIGI